MYGLIASQTVCLTNPGPFPLTFSPSHSAIRNTGFCVNLDKRIKGLPPDSMVEFDVIFDPAAVQCQQGRVETTLPFQVQTVLIYNYIYSIRIINFLIRCTCLIIMCMNMEVLIIIMYMYITLFYCALKFFFSLSFSYWVVLYIH